MRLQRPHLRHDDVVVILVTRHQVRVGDEADRVFIYQYLAAELHRLGRLATLIQLGMRLKDAEKLIAVGNTLALYNAAGGGVADESCQTQELLQLDIFGENFGVHRRLYRPMRS
jgi:hypothetical protein